ncbi:MAG: hypothetical protein HGA23_06915, partial [Bacteroidales bacterium]|nr:hypothetical protein [Bacteroidales bacterium]
MVPQAEQGLPTILVDFDIKGNGAAGFYRAGGQKGDRRANSAGSVMLKDRVVGTRFTNLSVLAMSPEHLDLDGLPGLRIQE